MLQRLAAGGGPAAEGSTRLVGAVLPAYAAFALGDMLGGQLARPLVARVRGDGGGGGGGGGRGV